MKEKTLLWVLLGSFLTALIVGGGIFWWQKRSFEKLKQELVATKTPILPSPISPTPTPPLPTPTPDPYANWLVYKNEVYNYEFRYPPQAVISEVDKDAFGLSPEEAEAGITFEDKYNKYTGKICITVSYKLGYVQISAPVNKNFAHVLCGRTGRAYEGPEREEELVIEGKKYKAKGFEEKGPGETLNFHNETLVVVLDDGTRIEYGSKPDSSATFADYQSMRKEIVKIVESFKKTV